MKDQKTLTELLEKYWDEQGACGSCSWHASLWKHDPEWENWDAEKGCFVLYCQNKDYPEESIDHREIRIYISDADKKKYKLASTHKDYEA